MRIASKSCASTASWMAVNGSGPPTRWPTGARAARVSSGSAVSSVQSAALRSCTSGISRVNSVGSALARRATSCSSRGVDAVRLATTRTRLGDGGPIPGPTISPSAHRHNAPMASYTVNDAAVAHARELIDARQYVLESDWGSVQPRAAAENAYLDG